VGSQSSQMEEPELEAGLTEDGLIETGPGKPAAAQSSTPHVPQKVE